MGKIHDALKLADVTLSGIAVSGDDVYRMVNARNAIRFVIGAIQDPEQESQEKAVEENG